MIGTITTLDVILVYIIMPTAYKAIFLVENSYRRSTYLGNDNLL